jgi:hypothetical protein
MHDSGLPLRQRHLGTFVVDAVISRIRTSEVGSRVVLERVRTAPTCGNRCFRSRWNHDTEAAPLAVLRAVEVVGAIAKRDFRRPDVVQDLRVGPRVGQRAVRNQIAAPRYGVGGNRHLEAAARRCGLGTRSGCRCWRGGGSRCWRWSRCRSRSGRGSGGGRFYASTISRDEQRGRQRYR